MSKIYVDPAQQFMLPSELDKAIIDLYLQATVFGRAKQDQVKWQRAGGDPAEADLSMHLDVLISANSPFVDFISIPEGAEQEDLYREPVLSVHRSTFVNFCDVAFILYEFATGRSAQDAAASWIRSGGAHEEARIVAETGWQPEPAFRTNPMFTVQAWKAISFYGIMAPVDSVAHIQAIRFKALMYVADVIRNIAVLINEHGDGLFNRITKIEDETGAAV